MLTLLLLCCLPPPLSPQRDRGSWLHVSGRAHLRLHVAQMPRWVQRLCMNLDSGESVVNDMAARWSTFHDGTPHELFNFPEGSNLMHPCSTSLFVRIPVRFQQALSQDPFLFDRSAGAHVFWDSIRPFILPRCRTSQHPQGFYACRFQGLLPAFQNLRARQRIQQVLPEIWDFKVVAAQACQTALVSVLQSTWKSQECTRKREDIVPP